MDYTTMTWDELYEAAGTAEDAGDRTATLSLMSEMETRAEWELLIEALTPEVAEEGDEGE